MAEKSSLKNRAVKAGSWTIAGYGISQAIRFGSNLLMTRLLAPEMFGVMAIAYVILHGLALFSDLGLRQSIVQSKRGSDTLFLNTAWTIQIIRGGVIWLFTVMISFLLILGNHSGMLPPNSVYATQHFPYVILVLSVSSIIDGLGSTKLHEANRNLLLGRITQLEIFSQVIGMLFMFAWVSWDRSVWAIVFGSLFATTARTFLSHAWLPGSANRWQWDPAAFHEIVHFGKWIFLSSILGFLVNSGDRILLGAWFSASTLGIYAIAFLFFKAAYDALSKLISDVVFPALGEVARKRPMHLKHNLYRFHIVIAALAYLGSGMLIISGKPMIETLYDQRYFQAGPMLEILACALLTIPFRIAAQCFITIGMPRILSKIIAIQLITLYLAMPIGFHFSGLNGAIWGFVLSYFSAIPITIFYQIKHDLFDLRKEIMLLPLIVAGMTLGKLLNLAIG